MKATTLLVTRRGLAEMNGSSSLGNMMVLLKGKTTRDDICPLVATTIRAEITRQNFRTNLAQNLLVKVPYHNKSTILEQQ